MPGPLTAKATVTGIGIPRGMTFTVPLMQSGPNELSFLGGEPILASLPFDHVTEGMMTIHWEIVPPNGAGSKQDQPAIGCTCPTSAVHRREFGVKPLYRTLLYIGCQYNNGNDDTEASVLKKAWTVFESLNVPQAATGNVLKYWGDYTNNSTETSTLLASSDGNCDAWSSSSLMSWKPKGSTRKTGFTPWSRRRTSGTVFHRSSPCSL